MSTISIEEIKKHQLKYKGLSAEWNAIEMIFSLPAPTPPPSLSVEDAAKEMADAIEQTMGQHSGKIQGEYDVSFMYPENNKAYKMLQASLKKYKAIAGASWQASQPTPPLPKLSAEEVYARKNNSWLNQHNSYEKKLIIQLMQEYGSQFKPSKP